MDGQHHVLGHHCQVPTIEEKVLCQTEQAVNKDEVLGKEADGFDRLPGNKLLIVGKCQMRNEMMRRFEPILQHLGAKQFVQFENRAIFGEQHKRVTGWLARRCRAAGKTTNVPKGDLECGHMDMPPRS